MNDQEMFYEKNMLQAAIRYANEAGEQIIQHMNEPYRIGDKVNQADLVTEIDVLSEKIIRDRIGQDYPDHWILSEETDGGRDVFETMKDPAPGYGWIIDPIDGTINFVHATGHFAVSIGIMKDGEILHGVVYNPTTRELFHATRGEGAFLNGVPIRASEEANISNALLATGFQASDWKPESVAVAQVSRVAGTSRSVRILGAASLDLCMIASGRLTGFWHDGLYPWDVAAGLVIVREAGGIVTNTEGKPYRMSDKSLIASNPKLQKSLLTLIVTGA